MVRFRRTTKKSGVSAIFAVFFAIFAVKGFWNAKQAKNAGGFLENGPRLLPNLHVRNQAVTQSVNVLHHLIG